MAHLEHARKQPACDRSDRTSLRPTAAFLPKITWKNGKPWKEANHWAEDQASSEGATIRTIEHRMVALCQYANWLEQEDLHWMQFPENNAEWALVQYERSLLNKVARGEYHKATAFAKFRAVLGFYAYHACRSPKKSQWLLELIQANVRLKFQKAPTSSVIVRCRVKRDG